MLLFRAPAVALSAIYTTLLGCREALGDEVLDNLDPDFLRERRHAHLDDRMQLTIGDRRRGVDGRSDIDAKRFRRTVAVQATLEEQGHADLARQRCTELADQDALTVDLPEHEPFANSTGLRRNRADHDAIAEVQPARIENRVGRRPPTVHLAIAVDVSDDVDPGTVQSLAARVAV